MKRAAIIFMLFLGFVYAQNHNLKQEGSARFSPRLLNYQGYLTDTMGIPLDGDFEMKFSIYDAASSGNQKWSEAQNIVSVDRGIFSVILGSTTPIPDSVFLNGADRWLELSIDNQTLAPRTRITAAAYAYTATYSDTAEYARVSSGDNDWVRGTPDSVLFTVNYLGIARGGAANVMFGDSAHTHVNFGYACTTGTNGSNIRFATVSGGRANVAAGLYSTVAGGYRNTASNTYASVGGGYDNTAAQTYTAIAGGRENVTSNSYSAITGGYNNTTSGDYAYIGGGYVNAAANGYTVVGGGYTNYAGGFYSVVGSGYADSVRSNFGFLGSGFINKVGDAVGDSGAVIISGRSNTSSGKYSFIGTGSSNTASGDFSVVTGGYSNEALAHFASLSGGNNNTVSDSGSMVGGGSNNWVASKYGAIGGGSENYVGGTFAAIAGGYADSTVGVLSFIGSGYSNEAGDDVTDSCAVVINGYDCAADGKYGFIGTGNSNHVSAHGVCVGGRSNTVSVGLSFIGSGQSNNISDMASYSAIAGGYSNSIRSMTGFIGGGEDNHITINAHYGTIAGGVENYIAGTAQYGAIPGGVADTIYADWYGFAANAGSYLSSVCDNSAVFNGATATSINQLRCLVLSKTSGSFTIDHPNDPLNKILNHYFVESPEMINVYRGIAVLNEKGYAEIELPAYFDALNRTPMIQLTGVGTSDVYVAEKVQGNRFAIAGKAGTEVYWTVTGDRKDPGAEITRVIMPVEQIKEGELSGRSLDDDFYAATKSELIRLGKDNGFEFRTARGRTKYAKLEELKNRKVSD